MDKTKVFVALEPMMYFTKGEGYTGTIRDGKEGKVITFNCDDDGDTHVQTYNALKFFREAPATENEVTTLEAFENLLQADKKKTAVLW